MIIFLEVPYQPHDAVEVFGDRVLDGLKAEQDKEARAQLEEIAKILSLQPKPGQEGDRENE